MSTCTRCGAHFTCAVADGDAAIPAPPCWCTFLPPAVPVPAPAASDAIIGCWCPQCLGLHIAALQPPATS
ncbi:MAG: cysteine-rich CWC family protein [Duganella sp.]